MRPMDLVASIAFIHIRLICDMEVRFSLNITPRLRASFVTEIVLFPLIVNSHTGTIETILTHCHEL